MTKKRIINLIPEIKGCYGPRVWVDCADTELRSIFTVLSVWGGPTDTRGGNINGEYTYQALWEFPFGFLGTDIWRNLIYRLNIAVVEDN